MKRTWQDYLNGNRSVESARKCGVYPQSLIERDGSTLLMISDAGQRKLIVKGSMAELFDGINEQDYVVCNTNVQNACKLMQLFEQFRPTSHRNKRASFGLGDRLGCATPGQLFAIRESGVFPILAQQSMREISLTGRNYRQVIADACFGAMTVGWQSGYGADGDHLKNREEVAQALDAGCTMITLDLSSEVQPAFRTMAGDALNAAFEGAFGSSGRDLINRYDNICGGGDTALPAKDNVMSLALVYQSAFRFVEDVWNRQIAPSGKLIDLEISLDETETETTPAEHYFVAMELKRRGVAVAGIAPRFPGEFQKAVDYFGDIDELAHALDSHAAIARDFGHKLSIHSGSDKWTAFPLIQKATKGHYHIKTSGTNWLEMVKMVAGQNPELYRRMHKHALTVFDDAKMNYHVSALTERIPDVDTLADARLPHLFEQDDTRQLMHITYGQLLNDKNDQGEYLLRTDIYRTLAKYEADYWKLLHAHIGKHLHLLGET